jgi:hypothetical protein
MSRSENDPVWRAPEVDNDGKAIRAEVLQAAYDIWPASRDHTRLMLGKADRAGELLKAAVFGISRDLDRGGTTPSLVRIKRLLSLHVARAVYKLSGITLEEPAPVPKQPDEPMNVEELLPFLEPRTRRVCTLRRLGYSWDSLAGLPAPHSVPGAVEELDMEFLAELPPDLDPGEAELLKGYDRWIHGKRPNPERFGCPERETLVAFATWKGKWEDDYALYHFSQCAACLDELLEIKKERKRCG